MIIYTVFRDAALVELCRPPVNAISLAMLEELVRATRRANDDDRVRGVVITGGKEQFSAGADLAIFRGITSGDEAMRVSRVFQEAFQAIEDSPKPVIAAVSGHVLGGALELAMSCHFRVAAEGSRFSMPEVKLGINPGAGGTQRLPRLAGLEAALEMLLGGRAIDARRALEWGLIDAVVPAEELADRAVEMIGRCFAVPDPSPPTPLPQGERGERNLDPLPPTAQEVRLQIGPTGEKGDKSLRGEKLTDLAARRAALARAEMQVAAGRPELIAPRMILRAIRVGVEEGFQAGFVAEQEAFRQCMATRATWNKIYVFSASRQTAKVADLESIPPARITEAGVLGMGTMGAGIAQALIAAGVRVTACDQNASALDAGRQRIESSLERRVSQGKLSADQARATLERLTTTLDGRALTGAQLVVEAVFEDVAVKREAIGRLEAVAAADAIIATNTSTINLDLLAEGMVHPERLVGLHFFHPAQQMPLVEVIRRRATPSEVAATAMGLAKAMGKTPVLVENREGFLVNRLFVPYLTEAFRLLEEGASPRDVDRAMVEFGFPMGPFELIDMSGLDILWKTQAILREAFPHHGNLSPIVSRLIEEGQLGQKTGAGVYRYEQGDRTPHAHPRADEIIVMMRGERSGMAEGIGGSLNSSSYPSPPTPLPQGERGDEASYPSPPTPLPQGERGDEASCASPPAPLPQGERGDGTSHLSPPARLTRGERGELKQPPALTAEWIVERLVLRMVAEAFRLLEEGIVRRPADVDVAMVLATGLADFRGGVVKYAYDLGFDRVLADLRRLAEEHGPRYAPCPLLEQAAIDPGAVALGIQPWKG